MSTPSKEALAVAQEITPVLCPDIPKQFETEQLKRARQDRIDYNAAIIDRHFEPLRRRAEQAEARVKEYEAQLSAVMPADFKDWHQNSRSEWPVVTASVIRNLQARMKELEACLVASRADCDRRDEWLDQERSELAALRAANAELQKQEAESRRLFYAEQDKRQSAEFGCEELAGALAKIKDATGDEGETWENVAAWMAAVASSALASREVQP